jgi:hypothetical protein
MLAVAAVIRRSAWLSVMPFKGVGPAPAPGKLAFVPTERRHLQTGQEMIQCESLIGTQTTSQLFDIDG